MAKEGTFTYVGRKDEPVSKFYSGDCGIITNSSGSRATIKKYAKFNFGVGMMPYDANVKGAPQNAIIGGASLWALAGKDPAVYKGVAKFLVVSEFAAPSRRSGIRTPAICRSRRPPTS